MRESDLAVVLRFGPVDVIAKSGWYFKLPWPLERVVTLDGRLQQSEIRLSETLTRDKRNVIAPMYFTWRIADAQRFLASVANPANATEKLDAIVTSARNSALGRHAFDDLVSLEGTDSTLETVEAEIIADAREDAATNLGVDLLAVGVLQIKLPTANTESVFRRMRAERKREATRYRAEGRSAAETIRAQTDKEASALIADAKRYAEETRGQAEADAARIYATAHGRDVAFYSFLRELQSLRAVVDRNTTLILDTDAPPFDLLKRGPATPRPNPTVQDRTPSRPANPAAALLPQLLDSPTSPN